PRRFAHRDDAGFLKGEFRLGIAARFIAKLANLVD
ncbi:MAG: hypothetical protein RLZZ136_1616, partial [Pseudomonadota bacterium]